MSGKRRQGNKQVNEEHYKQVSSAFVNVKAAQFAAQYLRNLTKGTKIEDSDVFAPLVADERGSAVAKRLSYRKRRASEIFDLEDDSSVKNTLRKSWNSGTNHDKIMSFIDELAEKCCAEAVPESDIVGKQFRNLQKMFKLSDLELEIITAAKLLADDIIWTGFGRVRGVERVNFYARCVDAPFEKVMAALSPSGKLQRYQMTDEDFEYTGRIEGFLSGADKKPFLSRFYSKIEGEALPLEFFDEKIRDKAGIIGKLIKKSEGKRGVNILLYGACGTGKTSFARAVVEKTGCEGYDIAQFKAKEFHDRNTSMTSSNEFRYCALQVCADRVDAKSSVLVVDEADRLLRDDKGMLNSVLDSVKVPIIWIANTPAGWLDPSCRRRFDYSIEFKPLTNRQRVAIWENCAKKEGVEAILNDKAAIKTLAEKFPTNAGGISLALKNATELAEKPEEIAGLVEEFIAPHCRLMNVRDAEDDTMAPAKDYSLEGLNIKSGIPLENIIAAVKGFDASDKSAADSPRMNLLLSGAPGTGKTEFVKYLGSVLGKKLSVKMGSNLLSKWVGGTEQNIRDAFEGADENTILFFDEIDGLVQSRAGADHNWEVTQVNEILHQMENFKGIFVGATNFATNLDPAIMRRFTFKVEFDFLTNEGKKSFFERMFGTALAPEEERRLNAIHDLAPGDFRTVRQSLYYLGGAVTNAMRLDALEQESRAKGKTFSSRGHIGFAA